jgi:hypothetical protein
MKWEKVTFRAVTAWQLGTATKEEPILTGNLLKNFRGFNPIENRNT